MGRRWGRRTGPAGTRTHSPSRLAVPSALPPLRTCTLLCWHLVDIQIELNLLQNSLFWVSGFICRVSATQVPRQRGNGTPVRVWPSIYFLLKHTEQFLRSALFCSKCRAFWFYLNLRLSPTRYLRSGCDSSTKVFAFNFLQHSSQAARTLPSTLTNIDICNRINKQQITLGVCTRELGLEPEHGDQCLPITNTAAHTEPGKQNSSTLLTKPSTDSWESTSFCSGVSGDGWVTPFLSSAFSFPLPVTPLSAVGKKDQQRSRGTFRCLGCEISGHKPMVTESQLTHDEFTPSLSGHGLFCAPKMSQRKSLPDCPAT